MIEVIVTVADLLGLGCGLGEVVWRCLTRQSGFTPGRRTRGIARWWARCTRWTRMRHVEPRRASTVTHRGEAVLTPEDVRVLNMKFIHDSASAWRHR